MSLIKINFTPSTRELRQFGGIWLPLFLALIGGMICLKHAPLAWAAAFWSIAVLVGLCGWLKPRAIYPIYLVWMSLTYPIGWLVSHVLFGLFYFSLFTLVGLLMRLFGHDPLTRRLDRTAKSYWTPYTSDQKVERYFRQF